MFQTQFSKDFFVEWLRLHADEKIPHYRTLFNRLSPRFVPHLLILEEGDSGSFLARFVGTSRAENWGRDETGSDTLKLISVPLAETFLHNVGILMTQSCGLYATNSVVNPRGRKTKTERLVLPVGTDPGRPRRVLVFTSDFDDVEYTEGGDGAIDALSHIWLDIGYGVPEEPARI